MLVATLAIPAAHAADDEARSGEPSAGLLRGEDPSSQPRVEVHLVGDLAGDVPLEQLLKEWFATGDMHATVLSQPILRLQDVKAPRSNGPPVRMWITLVTERRARLIFAEPDSARFLVRDVALPSGLDEMGRERLVQVALSSALAFVQEHTSSSLAELERSLGPTARERSVSPHRVRMAHAPTFGWKAALEADVLYGISDKGDEGIAQGPGVGAELLAQRGRIAVGGFIQGQYRFPRAPSTDRIAVFTNEILVAGGISVELRMVGDLYWRTELGAGTQIVHVDPTARSPDVTPAGAGWDVRLVLLGGFGPVVSFGELRLALGARLELQPVGTRYEIRQGGVVQPELIVPRLQPGVVITVSFRRSISESHAARSAESAPSHRPNPAIP